MTRFFALLSLGLLTLLLSVLSASAQKGGGPSFNPQVSVELDGYWVANPETVHIYSKLSANDVYFDAWVQFTPPQWGLAADADVPDGARVGNGWSATQLGNDNNPCNSRFEIGFEWLDATTDTTNFFTYDPAINPIYQPSWPGYDIMPSGLERAVEQYPDFLNTLFPGITPRARYYAHVGTGAGEAAFQLLIFEPGTALPGLPPFDPGHGYPALMVEQDPTAPPVPGRTWDVCTNWEARDDFWGRSQDNGATWANESGFAVRTNPSGWGSYPFDTFARARPDADGDGIENHLDTCPFDPNSDENPRQGSGPDGDGLDSVCDPAWDVHNPDEDGDGYLNRGDNCPLVSNGLAGDNQADSDGDGIGNACDPDPGAVNGPGPEEWRTYWVEVTGDSDQDGWSDAFEKIFGSNPNWAASYPEHMRADPRVCSDGVDNDLDGLVDGFDLGCDRDGDRVSNAFDACPEDPEDWDGFQDSDGCPDNDNDMDGRMDWEEGWTDQGIWCANIPEDYDAYRDWDGCPDPDNDQDGFPDFTDDCPGTDWTAGPDGIADSGDEPLVNGLPVQTREDYDRVLDTDGCHDSPGDDYDGDGLSDEDEVFIYGTFANDPDTDDDSVLDGPDNCKLTANPSQTNTDAALSAQGVTVYGALVPADPLGDACDNDDDNDSPAAFPNDWTDTIETFIGSDSLDACPRTVGVHDAWGPDTNKSRLVNVLDILPLKAAFGKSSGQPGYNPRADFNASGLVNALDLLPFKHAFGAACTVP